MQDHVNESRQMKLSEAIRKGIEQFPEKAVGVLFENENAACALGCAIYGRYGQANGRDYLPALIHDYPELMSDAPPNPLFPDVWLLQEVIEKLNDRVFWTREQIADWLESKGL